MFLRLHQFKLLQGSINSFVVLVVRHSLSIECEDRPDIVFLYVGENLLADSLFTPLLFLTVYHLFIMETLALKQTQ